MPYRMEMKVQKMKVTENHALSVVALGVPHVLIVMASELMLPWEIEPYDARVVTPVATLFAARALTNTTKIPTISKVSGKP
mmetsp:Transcript_851/g.2136  ORF Transcript_851/g.2136 Transcript_851/m.2136 type:complete len:81 (-) Transcript_851:578-820(-)